jgi:hypothetical protein
MALGGVIITGGRRMHWTHISGAVLLLAAAGAAGAQVIVNPARLPERLRAFEWRPDEEPLKCSVSAIHPALNYGFRFQAGYVVRTPMEQYRGGGHRWSIMMRVTPEQGGAPVYFLSRYRLPDVPRTTVDVEVGGGFLVGEGRYRVAWKMQDDAGRVCRSEWKIEAKRRRSERQVRVAMTPGAVDSMAGWVAAKGGLKDDAAPIRLTILMHAAAASPRRTRLNPRDRLLLLGTLSSVLERVPATSVRLVVFNLDQQRELYRKDGFQAAQFNEAAQAINELELGLVDYHVLQNRSGHVDLLADLVRQEVSGPAPSDVVLFLGPLARQIDSMPSASLERPQGTAPRFFYFQYRPYPRAQATLPDVITSAVSRLKGRTLVIHTPGEFAKGIAELERKGAPPRGGVEPPRVIQ